MCSHLLVVGLSCFPDDLAATSAVRPSVGMVTVSLSHLSHVLQPLFLSKAHLFLWSTLNLPSQSLHCLLSAVSRGGALLWCPHPGSCDNQWMQGLNAQPPPQIMVPLKGRLLQASIWARLGPRPALSFPSSLWSPELP